MQLEVERWGDGGPRLVLIHGFTDDAQTWWRVAPALAELGYRVEAVHLRGHGRSPRADSYLVTELAQDLLDSIGSGADIVIGHSLGALSLGHAAPRLDAGTTIYIDPPWTRTVEEFAMQAAALEANPVDPTARWSAEDVAVELSSAAALDPAVLGGLLETVGRPELMVVPAVVAPRSVVIVPEQQPVLPERSFAEVVELGHELVTIPGVGHVAHRDDFDGFMRVLSDVLAAPGQ